MANLSPSDIDQLLAHCRSKVGVEEKHVFQDGIQFGVLSGSLDFFATAYLKADPPYLLLRCDDTKREQLEKSGASARVSNRMKWSGPGWKWTELGLDGSVPLQTLTALVDASYDVAVVKLDDGDKRLLSVLARKLSPAQLLAEMIDSHDLQDRRADIERLALRALRLTTSSIDESQMPLGRSKIGGHPDLPASLAWPTFHGKRPLSFLAQINLGDVRPDQRLVELPERGILCVFSVYGWQEEGSSDPDVPRGDPQPAWTQILLCDDPVAPLRRHATPDDVSEYPAANVSFHPTLCLPTSTDEPSVAALDLDDDETEQFDEMTSAYAYAANYANGPRDRHLLLGYADWVQYVIEPVKQHDLRLLFQLASDQNTGMCWGDGGYIYAMISKPDLQQRRFANITSDYQCG